MAIMIEQRTQLLQSLGSIATSAADVAAEGIAEADKTDSKTVETALKLFGGFDRNEFENINRQAPNLLVPAVRPPASYEAPAEYFKPLSNVENQDFLVRNKDLLQQLEDPRFRMADGLSGFSDNNITKTLTRIVIINGRVGDMNQGGLDADAFSKLYAMENTIRKQVQMHRQLDFGAIGQFSAPGQNPRLDRGFKDLPDMQIANPSYEMETAFRRAMDDYPRTIGELVQMLDAIDSKVLMVSTDDPELQAACQDFHEDITYFKQRLAQGFPQDAEPSYQLISELEDIRGRMGALMLYLKWFP